MIYKVVLLALAVTFKFYLGISQVVVILKVQDTIQGRYYLNEDGLIEKGISYGPNATADTLVYKYQTKGKIDKITRQGTGTVIYFEQEFQRKHIDDVIFRDSFLREKGVVFPLPFINSSELGDMVMLFSVSDDYKIIINGNKKTILFDSIYQNIMFKSLIEKYIPNQTIIKKYKITLNKDALVKEEIVFDGGRLNRSYCYDKKNRLRSVFHNCIYDDKPEYFDTKSFDYQ